MLLSNLHFLKTFSKRGFRSPRRCAINGRLRVHLDLVHASLPPQDYPPHLSLIGV